MNEIELREKHQLLCDRISNILRNDRQFASRWGELFLSFGEIDKSWMDDYTGLETYHALLRAIEENPGGRFDAVREAMAKAQELERASYELLSDYARKNRVAEIRLRLICRTLNECFPADGDGSYRWAPAFERLDLPCAAVEGKPYDGSVKCADGSWMRPAGGTTDGNALSAQGHFTFNSEAKAAFAARHHAGLFRDWLDTELGYRRIEL